MFEYLKRLFSKKNKNTSESKKKLRLGRSLKQNIDLLKKVFADDETVVFREFVIHAGPKGCVVFIDGMIDKKVINDDVLQPLFGFTAPDMLLQSRLLEILQKQVITTHSIKCTADVSAIIDALIYGDTLILIDGLGDGLLVETKGWQSRSITEPESEKVVRGPREGFVESLSVNMSLIRRRIRSPKLKFQYKEVGQQTKTKLCICYIEGLAAPKILEELQHRLNKIDLDGIIESGYIEEMIMDSPLLPFRTVGSTERPDIVAAKLLEGRIAIICDGTPFVMTVPFVFMESFQANEDYYRNYIISSFIRIMRYLSFALSTSTPAIYVALTTYHQEILPTPLLFTISAARQGVPFPEALEAILLGFIFELLREGGVRLPAPIGQAVSIVGAIILGQAAVTARLASSIMIIVTALTGISGFLIPKLLGSVVLIRIFFLMLASFLGMYGYIFGVIALFIQLMSMRSFGVPYMLNWGSLDAQEIKDTMIRAPWWYMYLRPRLFGQKDLVRQPNTKLPERR